MSAIRFSGTLFVVLIGYFGAYGIAQSGISGSAAVSFSDQESGCGGGSWVVRIHIDVSGITGLDSESAGLNSFVLTFDISRPAGLSTEVFAYAMAANDPEMNWNLTCTNRDLVHASSLVTVVGWVADPDAPNMSYIVSNLVFSGEAGDITLTLVPSQSSLGSRVVLSSGDGPGNIPIGSPATPYTITLTEDFTLELSTAIGSWLTLNPAFNLMDPNGTIDVQDLIALINCGAY